MTKRKSTLKEMLTEEANKDFALGELAYIQKQTHWSQIVTGFANMIETIR